VVEKETHKRDDKTQQEKNPAMMDIFSYQLGFVLN